MWVRQVMARIPRAVANHASQGLIRKAKTPAIRRTIPTASCSRERRLTVPSRRDPNESAIRDSGLGCTGPSPAPNLPQIGREVGGWPVLEVTALIQTFTAAAAALWTPTFSSPPPVDTFD